MYNHTRRRPSLAMPCTAPCNYKQSNVEIFGCPSAPSSLNRRKFSKAKSGYPYVHLSSSKYLPVNPTVPIHASSLKSFLCGPSLHEEIAHGETKDQNCNVDFSVLGFTITGSGETHAS